jgi:hypothetical protein
LETLRSKAILKYLLDGDIFGFFESCYHAGKVYHKLCVLTDAGLPYHSDCFNLSLYRGVYSALLTQGFDELKTLYAVMPSEFDAYDDLRVAYFVNLLMEIIVDFGDDALVSIDSLEYLNDEEGIDTKTEIMIGKALLDKNRDNFAQGLELFQKRRMEEVNQEIDVMLGEKFISIECLALRRVGKELGLDVQLDLPLMPLDLQNSYPSTKEYSKRYLLDVGYDDGIENKEYWSDWQQLY